MQILQERLPIEDLTFAIATPADAQILRQLYEDVYHGEYPCPELFTEEGMAEFLSFDQSHTITVKFSYHENLIGCLSCEINGRAAYIRGGMVSRAWQGKVSARQAFSLILTWFRSLLVGRVEYLYGEARTETAKFHAIFDELGWRPLALLPRKDIFYAHRESEIIYAWHYTAPAVTGLRLSPRAALVASAVLGESIRPVVVTLPDFFPTISGNPFISYEWSPIGDGHMRITLPTGATLEALVCPASKNAEKIIIRATGISEYHALLECFLTEMKATKLEYAEVYAPTDSPAAQAILEQLGFSATGFLPQWQASGLNELGNYLVYTIHFPSDLPDCPPAFTIKGAFLQEFLPQTSSQVSLEESPLPLLTRDVRARVV